ncbi:hypothetical protein G4G27_10355 [Sphingomonas sp. So64.6b]|nr:hypothetical protein G4G27_10355 [Sphingomonas sp. So64.6b]
MLAALLAATALIPAAASAENVNSDRNDRGGAFRQGRGDGGQRVEPRRENPRPAPQAQPQQPRPQAVEGRGQGRGNWEGRPQVRQPQVQQPQGQPNRGGFGQNGRGQDWRGNGSNRPDITPGGRGPDVSRERPDLRVDGRGGRPDVRGDGRGGRPDVRGDGRGGRPDVRGDGRGGNDGNWRGNRGGNDGRNGNWRGDRGGSDARNGNGNWRDNRGGYNGRGGRDYNDRRAWNRDWRRDGRYNWNDRRARDRNAYHLPRYYAPYGWNSGYRRFSIGFTLSSILFNQNYWLDDASYYGLPDAYGEYRWVRYYNDALLVDIYTGEVVDTVYDIFW